MNDKKTKNKKLTLSEIKALVFDILKKQGCNDENANALEKTITKAEEADLLSKFNKAVEIISKREKINPTLFFSKKAQKDFLRLVFKEGIELACKELTLWRSQLIKEDILNLLR